MDSDSTYTVCIFNMVGNNINSPDGTSVNLFDNQRNVKGAAPFTGTSWSVHGKQQWTSGGQLIGIPSGKLT